MARIKTIFLTVLFGALLINLAPEAMAAERDHRDRDRREWDRERDWRRNSCRPGDRIGIQDLDMSPDPIFEGQRVRAWKVRLRLNSNRECRTEIEIREGRDTIARARRVTLRPGVNEITLDADDRYRFRGREHCLNVVVDYEGTRRAVDETRRFCARQRTSWSMREKGDPRVFDR